MDFMIINSKLLILVIFNSQLNNLRILTANLRRTRITTVHWKWQRFHISYAKDSWEKHWKQKSWFL